MKINAIDAAFVVLFALAVMMTVVAFLAIDGPAVAVRNVTIQEIPTVPSYGRI